MSGCGNRPGRKKGFRIWVEIRPGRGNEPGCNRGFGLKPGLGGKGGPIDEKSILSIGSGSTLAALTRSSKSCGTCQSSVGKSW